MSLGSRLKELRKRNRWTLQEVADRLKLSGHSTYSNWEYERTEPDLDMLNQIAKLYEVDVKYLMTGLNEITNYSCDLEDLLRDKHITFKGKIMTEDEKKKSIEILNILLEQKRH